MDDLPFGGIGPSGMGAYHGVDGFRTFSHARSVYKQSRFDISAMLRPPYGKTIERLLSVKLRR
jgi:coniferyl-aldehyde dehydrogenase